MSQNNAGNTLKILVQLDCNLQNLSLEKAKEQICINITIVYILFVFFFNFQVLELKKRSSSFSELMW